MKRFLSIAAVLTVLIMAFPARMSGQFRYGPAVGVAFDRPSFKQDLFTVDSQLGYEGGVMSELIFPGIGIGIDLGLLYEMRNAKLHLGERLMWESQGYGVETLRIHYIDIPLHIKLKWHKLNGLEDKIMPIVYGGPRFGIQVAHSKLDAFDFSGGDVGIDVGGGVELFRRFQITAGYTFGATYSYKAKVLTNFSARTPATHINFIYYF